MIEGLILGIILTIVVEVCAIAYFVLKGWEGSENKEK